MQKSLELGSPCPPLHCHWVGHSRPLLQAWSVLHWQSNSFWSGVDASWLHLKHPQVSRGCCTNRKDSCSNMLSLVGIYQPCQYAREAVNILFLCLSCIKTFRLSFCLKLICLVLCCFFPPWLESGEASVNCSPRNPLDPSVLAGRARASWGTSAFPLLGLSERRHLSIAWNHSHSQLCPGLVKTEQSSSTLRSAMPVKSGLDLLFNLWFS